MQLTKRLWNDECGFVASTDLLLICTIVILGMIIGLATFRDQVVQEVGDMAAAVGAINQSYSYGPFTVNYQFTTHMGTMASVVTGSFVMPGSTFVDATDFCDSGDSAGNPPECIMIQVAPSGTE